MKRNLRILLEGVLLPSVIFVLVVILVSIVFGLVVGVIEGLLLNIDTDMITNSLLVQGIADLLCLPLLLYLYLRFKRKYNIESGNIKINEMLHLIPIAFSTCIICNILLQFLPIEEENIVSEEIAKLVENSNIFIPLIIVSFIIPIVEELLFRGYFFDTISILGNKIIAIIITSICFAVIHGNVTQGLYALVAGLLLGYIKYKYNKVSYTIFMHLVMNFTSLVFASSIIELTDMRGKIYTIFICLGLFIFSFYRIEMKN